MPQAWPSIRSTARCVLPVLVGPSTATTRDGAWPVGRWLMTFRMWRRNRRVATRDCRAHAPEQKRLAKRKGLWLTDGTGAKRTVSESVTARDSSFVHHKRLYLNRIWPLDASPRRR